MLFFASACKKAEDPFDPEMDFKLRLLNEKGEEATVFKEGEKFSLSFLITNKLNETRFFIPNQLTNNKGLFRIIRIIDSLDLGQPYKSIICTGQKISINGKQNLELKVPWNPDSTTIDGKFCVQNVKKDDLKKGTYKTLLQGSLGIGTLESTRSTKNLDLLINFEIK